MLALKATLAFFAMFAVSFQQGEEGRFFLSITFDNTDSPRAMADAMVTLHQTARDLCDEHDADAYNVGVLEVAAAPPLRGEREAMQYRMEYVCVGRS